jgi:helix-turn-helix protein
VVRRWRMADTFADWIPKGEAAKKLGIGIRTLERRIQEQGLRVAHRRIPNRKPLAVLHPEDVASLEAEMLPPTPGPAQHEGNEIALRSVSRTALEVVALLRMAQTAPPLPLFLDLKAAAVYSGLPRSYLRELIQGGKLKAVQRGGWRVSRLALDRLAQ